MDKVLKLSICSVYKSADGKSVVPLNIIKGKAPYQDIWYDFVLYRDQQNHIYTMEFEEFLELYKKEEDGRVH
jgi:hypothetical protein